MVQMKVDAGSRSSWNGFALIIGTPKFLVSENKLGGKAAYARNPKPLSLLSCEDLT